MKGNLSLLWDLQVQVSTLINILGFIDRGYEGEYLLIMKIIKSSNNKLAEIRNHTVGFVFQNFKLIQNNTILRMLVSLLFITEWVVKSVKIKF